MPANLKYDRAKDSRRTYRNERQIKPKGFTAIERMEKDLRALPDVKIPLTAEEVIARLKARKQ